MPVHLCEIRLWDFLKCHQKIGLPVKIRLIIDFLLVWILSKCKCRVNMGEWVKVFFYWNSPDSLSIKETLFSYLGRIKNLFVGFIGLTRDSLNKEWIFFHQIFMVFKKQKDCVIKIWQLCSRIFFWIWRLLCANFSLLQ